MAEKITKLDAARRQLVTAVRLFFEERDPVSVYTLAHNAREILETLCEKKGIKTFTDWMVEDNPDKSKKDIYKILGEGRDFLKHAARDPDSVLESFSDEKNDHILYIAIQNFTKLTGKMAIEFQVFEFWYIAKKRNIFLKDEEIVNTLIDSVDVIFPDLYSLSRLAQKEKGLEALREAEKHPEILNDPRTDITELHRWLAA